MQTADNVFLTHPLDITEEEELELEQAVLLLQVLPYLFCTTIHNTHYICICTYI